MFHNPENAVADSECRPEMKHVGVTRGAMKIKIDVHQAALAT
jgi:hypothetical protein